MASAPMPAIYRPGGSTWRTRFEAVNKELWIVLTMFLIAALLNFAVASPRMVLVLYTLPTLGSAYFYGRRHATLTALASVLVVALLAYAQPAFLEHSGVYDTPWFDILLWGGVLVLNGYLVGTLYEHQSAQLRELRETYYGVLEILRHFIANDKYTENHCYRTAIYSVRIATYLDFSPDALEDVRAAGLLHDIGKLHIGRELLYKAARLTREEYENIRRHVPLGVDILDSVGGSLRRVLPIVLAHHERFDGKGPNGSTPAETPLAARVVKVADVYDALTSDRPYRKAMSPFEAKATIVAGVGTEFDPVVVEAFEQAFRAQALELSSVVV
jgi:putative nucleotidyltransferase with HDIG domain